MGHLSAYPFGLEEQMMLQCAERIIMDDTFLTVNQAVSVLAVS
jgi:hypothetical protein